MFNLILILSGLLLYSSLIFSMLPSDTNNLNKLVAVQKEGLVAVQKEGKEILLLEHSPQALALFEVFPQMATDCPDNSKPLPIVLNDHMTPHTVIRLLMQAEDLTKELLFEESFAGTLGLMCLADNLQACEELKSKIAQIRYKDHIYDDLYEWALTTKEGKKSKKYIPLERAEAREWLSRCIPYASDEKKTEIREKLYPLQYSSPSFLVLKSKIGSILKAMRWHEREVLNSLPEFKGWQASFEHKVYCAARPSYAISCTEFYAMKKNNRYEVKADQNTDEIDRATGNKKISLICSTCKQQKNISAFKLDGINILACNVCMKEYCKEKVVDLSDCYNLDRVSLHTIVGLEYFYDCSYNKCDTKKVAAQEYLEHLPQIHFPMLGLLLHYKGINYYSGDGGYYFSCTKLTFGTGLVGLHPIDISGLELFKHNNRDSLTCIFNINTTNDVISLKPALAKLRKNNGFFIEFRSSDADLEYEKWNKRYPAIFRDDKWFTTDLPLLIDFQIKGVG